MSVSSEDIAQEISKSTTWKISSAMPEFRHQNWYQVQFSTTTKIYLTPVDVDTASDHLR